MSQLMAYERAIAEDPSRFAIAKHYTVGRLGIDRGDQQLPGLEAPAVSTSEAYQELLKRAEGDRHDGESVEQAFARIYSNPVNRPLVDADRAEQHTRVIKAMGGLRRG